MSRPARSPTALGPIAMPKSCRALSMASGPAPSSIISSFSRPYAYSIRLPTKPKALPTGIAILPMRLVTACAVASASREDSRPCTTSTSRMTFAGLKKCMPTTSAGRREAAAIASTSSVDVFVASTAAGPASSPSRPKTSRFTARFSNTASITRSAPATAARVSEPCTRARAAAAAAASSRPLRSDASIADLTRASPASSASCFASTSVTAMPPVARLIAMPEPIVPGAEHGRLPDGTGEARIGRRPALGEEQVAQCARFDRLEAFEEQRSRPGHCGIRGQQGRARQSLDDTRRSRQATGRRWKRAQVLLELRRPRGWHRQVEDAARGSAGAGELARPGHRAGHEVAVDPPVDDAQRNRQDRCRSACPRS